MISPAVLPAGIDDVLNELLDVSSPFFDPLRFSPETERAASALSLEGTDLICANALS